MRTVIASLAIAALAACGGSDKDPGTVNPQSARTSIDQVGNVNAAVAASDGNQAASAVAAMTAAGQSIVSPSAPAGKLIGLAPATLPKSEILAAITGTANCTPTGCTFTNYGDDTPGNMWTINGTIGKSGDTISFDLTYDVTSGGTSVDWTIDGAVTVTPSMIDGDVSSTGSTNAGAGGNVNWDVDVSYNAVQLDGAGCPIGGSITAATSYEVGGQGVYNVEGTVTFGPNCGDAR